MNNLFLNAAISARSDAELLKMYHNGRQFEMTDAELERLHSLPEFLQEASASASPSTPPSPPPTRRRNKTADNSSTDFKALFDKRLKVGAFDDPQSDEGNDNAIFKSKYIRRAQMMLLVSTLGVGKSTFVSQGGECWARGLPFFGFTPARPLSIGVFETEDDGDEVADFRDNFRIGFKNAGWTELEIAEAENGERAPTYYPLDGITASNFLDYLDYCTTNEQRDLVVINPAYDFIEGDFSKAEDVHKWKSRLLDIAKRNRFAVLLVHHTSKVPTNAKERDGWCSGTSAAYAGSGSMVLPSSARAVVFIRPLEKKQGMFEICAAKRGRRLGWRDADGNPTILKYAAHSDGFIFWREPDPCEVALVASKHKDENKLPAGVQRLIDVCTQHRIPFDSVTDLRAAVHARFECSDEAIRNWINKAVEMTPPRIQKRAVKGTQKVLIGLPSQFGNDEE